MSEDLQVAAIVATAYERERMTVTLNEIQQRATGRPRWAPALAGMLATAVIMAVAVGFVLYPPNKTMFSAPNDLTTACMDEWTVYSAGMLESVEKTTPVRRFILGTGDSVAHIYASREVLLECLREGNSIRTGAMRLEKGRLSEESMRINYFGHYGKAGDLSYLVGDLPEGMTSVSARLANGDTVQAQVSGELFALWHPNASLEGAVLSASKAGGEGPTQTHPTLPGAIQDEHSFDVVCQARFADTKSNGKPNTGMRLLYARKEANHMISFYVNDWIAGICELERDRRLPGMPLAEIRSSFGVSYAGLDRALAEMEPLRMIAMGPSPEMFYFGRSIKDAKKIDMYLQDGSVVPAVLDGDFFFAHTVNGSSKVEKVVCVTSVTTYVYQDGKLTTGT